MITMINNAYYYDKVSQQWKKIGSEFIIDSYPVGSFLLWSGTHRYPSGFMECKGQLLNKADYSELFSVIEYTYGGSGNSFNLPKFDDGRFFRSTGGNADTLGRLQGDAIRNITGEFNTSSEDFDYNNAAYYNNGNYTASGVFGKKTVQPAMRPILNTLGKTQAWTFDASKVVPTANENRPTNSSMIVLIKVKTIVERIPVDNDPYATEIKAGIFKVTNSIESDRTDRVPTEKALRDLMGTNIDIPYIIYEDKSSLSDNTVNVRALVPFAKGIATFGKNVQIQNINKNITIQNSELTEGDNFLYLNEDGTHKITKTMFSVGRTFGTESGLRYYEPYNKWYNIDNHSAVTVFEFEDLSGTDTRNKYKCVKVGNPTLENGPKGKCVKLTANNFFNNNTEALDTTKLPSQIDSFCFTVDFISNPFVNTYPCIVYFNYGYASLNSSSEIVIHLKNSTGIISVVAPYNFREWSRLTINATPTSVDIYREGVKVKSQPVSNLKYVKYINDNSVFKFGGFTPGGNNYQFEGSIARFIFFNRALNEKELKEVNESTSKDAITKQEVQPLNYICNLKKTGINITMLPISIDIGLGIGQTWQNVTAQRQKDIVYTNTTNRAIMINVAGVINNSSEDIQLLIDNVLTQKINIGNRSGYVCAVVPVGATYKITTSSNSQINPSTLVWMELR